MSPTAAPERALSGTLVAVSAPKRLMTPAGYLAMAVLMVATAIIVFKVTSSFSDAGGGGPIPSAHEEIDLGQVTRELAPEPGGLMREPFMLRIILVLNPKCRDLGALKAQVERRRNLFRDIVWSEIIDPKTDADLRKPAILESLKAEIRQRINQELGGAKDGQETISRVIFPERRLPERR